MGYVVCGNVYGTCRQHRCGCGGVDAQGLGGRLGEREARCACDSGLASVCRAALAPWALTALPGPRRRPAPAPPLRPPHPSPPRPIPPRPRPPPRGAPPHPLPPPKVAAAATSAAKYYQRFLSSFLSPATGQLPDRVDSDNEPYFLMASFGLGRMMHKMRAPPAAAAAGAGAAAGAAGAGAEGGKAGADAK